MSNPGCPSCGTRTELVRWEDVAGFECGECHGHFIRPASLAKFFDKHEHLEGGFAKLAQAVRDAPEATRNLSCPECRAGAFRALRIGLVELDACAGCIGIYFDADEASRYFSQTRLKAAGGKAVHNTVTAVDGLGALIDIISKLVP